MATFGVLAAPRSASLSLALAGGEAVGEVAAGQMLAPRPPLAVGVDLLQIAGAGVVRALGDPVGDLAYP